MKPTDLYIPYDIPVEYKGLKIYPIKVKEYMEFSLYSLCLIVEKNSIPNPEIIKMGYLKYLYYATMTDSTTPYIIMLDNLLKLCLRDNKEEFENIEESVKKYSVNENDKAIITIGGIIYNEDDFEKIKEIIAEQNLLELPDESISKEVRDSLREAKEYRDKLTGSKQGSFEDYIISLAISTGWSFEYIYELSIRKFIYSIRRLDNLIHYKIYLSASMSGMVEFKDKSFIKHWLTNIEDEDKYSDVKMDLDDVKNKISQNSA